MTKIKFFLFFLIASALHNCYAQNNLAKLDSSYSTARTGRDTNKG
jgi:hypothetical protein